MGSIRAWFLGIGRTCSWKTKFVEVDETVESIGAVSVEGINKGVEEEWWKGRVGEIELSWEGWEYLDPAF